MEDEMNNTIEVHDLCASYQGKPVLWDVDLCLPGGRLIGIVGPNGAGKSTLFKIMMGLHPADSGYVKFFEKPLNKVRKRISYVPQRQSVDWNFPALVKEIVMMGRYAHIGLFKRPKAKDHQVVEDSLAQVGITHLANRQIGRLSGGQQQRVFMARALAQQADIYLLDEPFAGVDTKTEQIILKNLQRLADNKKTVLIVHHSLASVARHCTYTILLNMYVRAAGPTEEVLTQPLLEETYSSHLNILNEVSEVIAQESLPMRSPLEK